VYISWLAVGGATSVEPSYKYRGTSLLGCGDMWEWTAMNKSSYESGMVNEQDAIECKPLNLLDQMLEGNLMCMVIGILVDKVGFE